MPCVWGRLWHQHLLQQHTALLSCMRSTRPVPLVSHSIVNAVSLWGFNSFRRPCIATNQKARSRRHLEG
jgi:hypothetical protein